jgi:hypothetical protein
MLVSVLTLLASLALAAEPTASLLPDEVAERYAQLHDAADDKGLAALWREHTDQILYTIDADLERSLKIWEADPKNPDSETIAELHARALWGARIASEVTGDAIFADYASAFVGWTSKQKEDFRAGQQAFGRGRNAMGQGQAEAALEAAIACRELALPLGDWWGTAMGLSLEGKLLAEMGHPDQALAPLSRARLLYEQLGLVGAEFGVLVDLLAALRSTESWERVLVVAAAVADLAERFDQADGRSLAQQARGEALKELKRDG